ncbi:MAG: hypothetical protein AAGA60_10795 [Cyanobacteria bacterium P01_E01_bin.42]
MSGLAVRSRLEQITKENIMVKPSEQESSSQLTTTADKADNSHSLFDYLLKGKGASYNLTINIVESDSIQATLSSFDWNEKPLAIEVTGNEIKIIPDKNLPAIEEKESRYNLITLAEFLVQYPNCNLQVLKVAEPDDRPTSLTFALHPSDNSESFKFHTSEEEVSTLFDFGISPQDIYDDEEYQELSEYNQKRLRPI